MAGLGTLVNMAGIWAGGMKDKTKKMDKAKDKDKPEVAATAIPDATTAWYVYILQCRDGSFYTGITVDPARRLSEHNGALPGGAKYTACRRPVRQVYLEHAADRSAAQSREWDIKQLTRAEKKALIAGGRVT